MVSLLSVESQVLQLFLILSVVQDRLRQYNIFVDLGVEVSEGGPLAGIDLHDIEHHLVLESLFGVLDISVSHSLQKFGLSGSQLIDLFLGMH